MIRDSKPILAALRRLTAEGTITSGQLLCSGFDRALDCRIEVVAPGEPSPQRAEAVRRSVRAATGEPGLPIAVTFVGAGGPGLTFPDNLNGPAVSERADVLELQP